MKALRRVWVSGHQPIQNVLSSVCVCAFNKAIRVLGMRLKAQLDLRTLDSIL